MCKMSEQRKPDNKGKRQKQENEEEKEIGETQIVDFKPDFPFHRPFESWLFVSTNLQ